MHWEKKKSTTKNWLRKRDFSLSLILIWYDLLRRFNACPSVALLNNVIIISLLGFIMHACKVESIPSSSSCYCCLPVSRVNDVQQIYLQAKLTKAFNYSHRMDCFRAHHNHICNHRVLILFLFSSYVHSLVPRDGSIVVVFFFSSKCFIPFGRTYSI